MYFHRHILWSSAFAAKTNIFKNSFKTKKKLRVPVRKEQMTMEFFQIPSKSPNLHTWKENNMTVRSPIHEWTLYIFGISLRLWKSNTAMSAITVRIRTEIMITAWTIFKMGLGPSLKSRYVRIPETKNWIINFQAYFSNYIERKICLRKVFETHCKCMRWDYIANKRYALSYALSHENIKINRPWK